MRSIDEFSSSARQKASERLRLIDHTNALKVGYKPHFWTVPLLLRLIYRVDEMIVDNPVKALGLAEGIPRLARRIPIQSAPERPDEIYYEDEREAVGFRAWAHSVLSSCLCAAGRLEDSKWHAQKALALSKTAPTFARGEVFRRVALLHVNLTEYDRAMPLAEESIRLFDAIGNPERLALSRICRGTILNLRDGPGSGSVEYATAIHCAAQVRNARSERALVIAAANLAMCVARSATADLEKAYHYIVSAIGVMNKRRFPAGLPKLTVRWAEAVIAYRFGAGRYSIKWLERVRDHLLQAGALGQGICCIADLLAIVEDYSPEELERIAADSLDRVTESIEGTTPESEAASVIEAWAKHPSDVEALLKDLGRHRCVSGGKRFRRPER